MNIKWFVVAFAVLITAGVVFALANSNITVQGYATINPDARAVIRHTYIVGARPGEEITNTDTVGATSVMYNLAISRPGEERFVRFRIQNTGNVLLQASMTTTGVIPQGIDIHTPDFTNFYLAPGAMSDELAIRISRSALVLFEEFFTLQFTTTLDYGV